MADVAGCDSFSFEVALRGIASCLPDALIGADAVPKAMGLEHWMRWERLVWKHGSLHFASGLSHFKVGIDGRKVSVKAYAGAQLLF